jgi:hypothetical protein
MTRFSRYLQRRANRRFVRTTAVRIYADLIRAQSSVGVDAHSPSSTPTGSHYQIRRSWS